MGMVNLVHSLNMGYGKIAVSLYAKKCNIDNANYKCSHNR